MDPPPLMDEFLLRVPPDDLARAALVCKLWRRLASDTAFRRRHRDLHRAPTMLGFLCDVRVGGSFVARFVPMPSFHSPRVIDHRDLRAHDARHGRVLFHAYPYSWGQPPLFVWDPITGLRTEVPSPPRYSTTWKATVLCAATGTGACDHQGCHRGPFVVVFIGTDGNRMFSCVYSSEAGAWSEPIYCKTRGRVSWARSALAGNALYLVLEKHEKILKYDLGTQKMSGIKLPYVRTELVFSPFVPIELTTMEDGRLGFARVEETRLCLWSRTDEDVGRARCKWGNDEDAGWELSKVIELDKLLPLDGSWATKPCLLGFAEGVGVIFLCVGDGLFSIDLKSRRARKVYESLCITCVVPYINLYDPVMGVPSTDGPRAGASSDGQSCAGGVLLSQGEIA